MPKAKSQKTGAKKAPPKTSGAKSRNRQSESTQETFRIKGEELLGKVKEIIKEGNARRLIIKDKRGHVMIEFPLTIGVVATVVAPVLAAIGAIAALITECSITVERDK